MKGRKTDMKSVAKRALRTVMAETNGWDDLKRATREDMAAGAIPRSPQQPRAFGMSVADSMKPGEGRQLSGEEAGTLLELMKGLIELAREDRATYEREVRGILQTLHSRQMDLPRLSTESRGMKESMSSAQGSKHLHPPTAEEEKRAKELLKDTGTDEKADNYSDMLHQTIGVVQAAAKKYGTKKESRQRVTETQLRNQIRQQLIEEGFFDGVKDAAKGVAGAAVEAGTKALLKKVAKAILGKEIPEAKVDEMEMAIKHILPALMNQPGSTFLKQLEKIGNLPLGKAAEKGAEKLGLGDKGGERGKVGKL